MNLYLYKQKRPAFYDVTNRLVCGAQNEPLIAARFPA